MSNIDERVEGILNIKMPMYWTIEFQKTRATTFTGQQPEPGHVYMETVSAFITEADSYKVAEEKCRALGCWPNYIKDATTHSSKSNPCQSYAPQSDEMNRLLSRDEYNVVCDRRARNYYDCVYRSTTPAIVLCDRTLNVCSCLTQLEVWQAFWDCGAYLNEQFKNTTREVIPFRSSEA